VNALGGVEEVDRRSDHQKLTLKTDFGRVLVRAPLYAGYEYGDLLRVRGVLEFPPEDIDAFNYAAYLARYRIWLWMPRAQIEVVERGPPSLRRHLYRLKFAIETRLSQLFFEPEASFAAGLLLGSRKGMPEDLSAAFQRTGLTHIVAVSGSNISLVIVAMFWLTAALPFRRQLWLSAIAVLCFVLLVGASAAVFRAGVMGGLTLLGLYSGRRSQVYFALLWTAAIMLLINPYVLVYDLGFQLSFASTLGLLVFAPMLEHVLPGKALIWEALRLTLAAQLATFPLLCFAIGRISLIAPLANMLVAPLIPLGMGFAAAALVLGPIPALLGMVFLKSITWIAMLLAALPWADVPLKFSSLSFVISSVGLISFSLFFYRSTLARAFDLDSVEVFCQALGLVRRMHD
jgi:competence protein ComEC